MMIVKSLMPGLAPSLLRYLSLKLTVLGFLKHLTNQSVPCNIGLLYYNPILGSTVAQW